MTRPASRLLASFKQPVSSSYSISLFSARQCTRRAFSQTCLRQDDNSKNDKQPPASKAAESTAPSSPTTRPTASSGSTANTSNVMSQLGSIFNSESRGSTSAASETMARATGNTSPGLASASTRSGAAMGNEEAGDSSILGNSEKKKKDEDWSDSFEPFHFHVKSHKRNCHITVTRPDRSAIISVSTGNIGFRKTKRGTYDAAFQLTSYVIDKLYQNNWHRKIHALEVVLRGFGQGREASSKVLLGNEARLLRPKITMVSDDTKIKFGGTRSPKPRKL